MILSYPKWKIVDEIIVASSFSKETLKKNGVEEKKMAVIPYGTDTDFFKPEEKRGNHEVVKFVFVGLVDARKGVPVLLEVWKKNKYQIRSFNFDWTYF